MNTCERVDYCGFFQGILSEMPSIAEQLKKDTCLSDKQKCARYRIYQKLMAGYAPDSEVTMVKISREMQYLFPNDGDKAERIIKWLSKN